MKKLKLQILKQLEVIFAFEDLNNLEVLRRLYNLILGCNINEELKEEITLTLFPKSILINVEEFKIKLTKLEILIKKIMLIDKEKYDEYVRKLAIIKSMFFLEENNLQAESLLNELNEEYNFHIEKNINPQIYGDVIKFVNGSCLQIETHKHFIDFIKQIINEEALKIPDVQKIIVKKGYEFLKDDFDNVHDLVHFYTDEIINDLVNKHLMKLKKNQLEK